MRHYLISLLHNGTPADAITRTCRTPQEAADAAAEFLKWAARGDAWTVGSVTRCR